VGDLLLVALVAVVFLAALALIAFGLLFAFPLMTLM